MISQIKLTPASLLAIVNAGYVSITNRRHKKTRVEINQSGFLLSAILAANHSDTQQELGSIFH